MDKPDDPIHDTDQPAGTQMTDTNAENQEATEQENRRQPKKRNPSHDPIYRGAE